MDWLEVRISARYGKAKLQRGEFLHIGHRYRQLDTYAVLTDLQHFIQDIREPYVPSNLNLPLQAESFTDLRSVNGSMCYAAAERPDRAGPIAIMQQAVNANAPNRELREAVMILRELKATNDLCLQYHPFPEGAPLRLTLPGDSGLRPRDEESKYPQVGHFALLEDATEEVGGLSHIWDFGSRKGGRVATSTFKAETGIVTACAELAQKRGAW